MVCATKASSGSKIIFLAESSLFVQILNYQRNSPILLEYRSAPFLGLCCLYQRFIKLHETLLSQYMYADDTALYLGGQTVDEINNSINEDLVRLAEWLQDNKLVLNVPKTKYRGGRGFFLPTSKKIRTKIRQIWLWQLV